jgi:hypothetical protein
MTICKDRLSQDTAACAGRDFSKTNCSPSSSFAENFKRRQYLSTPCTLLAIDVMPLRSRSFASLLPIVAVLCVVHGAKADGMNAWHLAFCRVSLFSFSRLTDCSLQACCATVLCSARR